MICFPIPNILFIHARKIASSFLFTVKKRSMEGCLPVLFSVWEFVFHLQDARGHAQKTAGFPVEPGHWKGYGVLPDVIQE